MPEKQRMAAGTTSSASSGNPGEPVRPRGKPRGRRRDRDCITCKSRGLKCDLNRPQCLPCVQAGIACGGYAMRVVWQEERQRLASTASANKVTKPARAPAPVSTSTSTATLASRASTSPTQAAPPNSSSPTFSISTQHLQLQAQPQSQPQSQPQPQQQQRLSSPPAMLPMSPASSTMSVVSSQLIEQPWCETDQNSLIRRLAALCNHILTTEATETSEEAADTHSHPTHAHQGSRNQVIMPHAAPGAGAGAAGAGAGAGAALPSTTVATNANNNGTNTTTTTTISSTSHVQRNQYLSLPETTGLLSDLCVFIQARLEGRSLAPRQQPPDSMEMVKHRLSALAHVNRAIAAANPFAFLGIATFAVFEVCDDTAFGEWQRHLYGARHLLDYHHCRTLADLHRLAAMVPGLLDILARLVWFDVSGAVVHGVVGGPIKAVTNEEASGDVFSLTVAAPAAPAAPLTPARPGLIFDDWHRQVLLDDEFFATVGVPADACALYVDVAKSRLARRPVQACLRAAEQILRVESGSGLSDWDLSANVARCAAALAALSQAQAARKDMMDIDGGPDNDNDSSMAEEDATWESTTAAAVDKLCASLAATPASSRFYIHLAAGAYVGGMQARTRAHCAVIKQYWRNCNLCGISRYPGGLARCEEHWRQIGLLGEGEGEGK